MSPDFYSRFCRAHFAIFASVFAFLSSGVGLHAQLTFDPANPPTSATPPTEIYNEYTGTFEHQKGPKTVIVFLIRPSDGAAWASPPSFATLDGQLNTASANYYNVYSHRQTWFGPKRRNGMDIPRLVVTTVLNLPGSTATYQNSFGQLQSDCQAAVRALGGVWASGQVNDYNNFDRWVVMSNTKLIDSTGSAYVGGRFSWSGGNLSGGVAEHEWGHNWGVYHANAWNVSAGAAPRSPSGSSEEYKDGWDLMGGNSIASGFNLLFRESLGFLERSRNEILDVTTSGTYRIYDYIHPDRRQTASLLRGLLIPMTSFTDPQRIFLGFGHGATGTDARTIWNRNAVTVHTKLDTNGSSRIDTTPGSSQTGDADDSSIKIGRTYSEGPSVNGTQMYGGFHITPVARGADTVNGQTHEWIDVVVNYQNAIPSNQPPVASYAQSQYAIATGSPLTFAITSSDPNGDTLAYDWDFGDGTVSLSNSASQTKTWSAAGLYLVTCTVSDMKGGTVAASTWINVGNQLARTPDAPAATSGSIDYEVFTGSWAVLPNFNQLLPTATGTIATIALPPGLPTNNFAVRYTGYLNIPATDIYQFSTTSEDGSRLRIGGVTVVSNDGQRSVPITATGNAFLAAGLHAFTLEYFSRDGTPSLALQWRTGTTTATAPGASAFRRIDWAANAAPVVAITNPEENTELVVGASVLLQSTATDTNGIAKVQYFAGTAYLGESTTAPYEVTWSNLSPGTKQVQAYATDTSGRTALSAVRTFTVVSPPPRNLISIKFAGDSLVGGVAGPSLMNIDDFAGAVYQSANWTNLRATGGYGDPLTMRTMTGTTSALPDQTGTPTTASITPEFNTEDKVATNSPANSGNSRLMRSYAWKSKGTIPGTVTVSDLPYAVYDVYVYFDAKADNSNDIAPSAYTLNGVTKYGQNAASLVAGKGDFPSYATWTDYKEATATSASAPISERLGNYLVFRNQSGPSFTLTLGDADPINGLQIVEATEFSTAPGVRLIQTGGSALAEGGPAVAYLARLLYAPDTNVTLTLNPGTQLSVNRSSLTFTPANWQTPQVVLVSAVDDATPEGAHTATLTHTVSATGNYASVTAPSLTYSIADNDTPVVAANVVQHAAEHATTPSPGLVRVARSHLGSYAASLTVNFLVTGDATSSDFTLSGAATYNATTGVGTVVIPAGQSQAVLTLAPVNNTTAELQETATITVQANAAYSIGANGAASVFINDDDTVDYLTQFFSDAGSPAWDLNNTSITFTPSGGTYTAVTTPVTAFPSGTSSFTAYNEGAMTESNNDNGSWTQALGTPFTFFGVSYSSVKVSTNGVLFFAGAYSIIDADATLTAHFRTGVPRIAGLGTNLQPNTAGSVNYRRITETGQNRHVFYYNGVRVYSTSNNVNFQIELFDDGRIRLTWLAATSDRIVAVGLSSGVSTTMPSAPFTTTSSPRPFYPSDLSNYGTAYSANVAPAFVSTPGLTATAGQPYSYAVVATDANANTLTLTAPTKPAWLTLTATGSGTATLSGTAPAGGSSAVTLRVSDGTTTTDQVFTVNTLPTGGNTAPVFTSTPGTLASSGIVYTYAVTATDADGHTLTLDATSKPSWLTFTATGPGTATLTGTPPPGIPTPSITLSANDGFATSVQSFSLSVSNPPVAAITRPVERVITLADLTTDLHLTGTAADDGLPAALTTTWSQVSGPGTAVFSAPSALTTRVSFPVAGRYVLRFTASDSAVSSSDEIQVYAGGTDPDAPRTTGLAGYWKFDEGTGTTAADFSGSSRTATLAGGSSWLVTGYSGTGLTQTAPATSAYATYEYTPTHPTAFTIAAWVRLDEMPASSARYLFDTFANNTRQLSVFVNTGSRKLRVASNRSTDGSWDAEYLLPSNTWVHVAVSYDSALVTNDPVIYINGVSMPVTELAIPSGAATASSTGRIGSNWRGGIDEFRLYSRLVPATEIAALAVPGAFNSAPVVSAGTDKDVQTNGTVTLDGSATDDGLPAAPGVLTLEWCKDSGPTGGQLGSPNAAITNYTAAGEGSYVLRLTADDGSITASRTVSVVALAPIAPAGFDGWIGGYSGLGTLTGVRDDPDGDGIANLIEYALGGDPATPDTDILPVIDTVGGDLTLTYTRPKNLTALTYTVEVSTTLAAESWSTTGITTEIIASDATTETIVASVPLAGTGQFLRLKVIVSP